MSILRIYKFSRSSYLLALILIFSLVSCSGGDGGDGGSVPGVATASLSWVAPEQREDGSVMVLSDIAGYRIYYGVEPGNYQSQIDVSDGSAVQAQISGISRGTYYIVLTTIDVDGRESAYSPEVIVTI
jgi:hypothetical protein